MVQVEQNNMYKGCSESKERLRIQPAHLFHSGSVSYSCVRNCHRTFAIPQNLCTLGQAAFWYEEGISKLVSRYKCLNVQGDYVEK